MMQGNQNQSGWRSLTWTQLGALVLLIWAGYTAFAIVAGVCFAMSSLLYSLALKQLAVLWWLIRPW